MSRLLASALQRTSGLIFWFLLAAPAMAAETAVFIASPPNGAIVIPGTTLTLEVKSTGATIVSASLVGGDVLRYLKPNQMPPPATKSPFLLQVPLSASMPAGPLGFVVSARLSDGKVYFAQPLLVGVDSVVPITTISVRPRSAELKYVGEPYRFKVYDQTNSLINAHPRLKCISLSPEILQVSSLCDVRSIAMGEGQVLFEINGLQALIQVMAKSSIRGDLNGDGVVDELDVDELQLFMDTRSDVVGDARDLNGDGKIDALDLRVLTTLCTRPRCATQ